MAQGTHLTERLSPFRRHWPWLAASVGLFCALLWHTLAPNRLTRALDMTEWGAPQWVPTLLLAFVLVALWGLGTYMHTLSGRIDEAWDEVDRLRGEVGDLTEKLHAATGAPQSAKAPTTVIPVITTQQGRPVEDVVDTGPVTGPIVTSDRPSPTITIPTTTIPGIPSARPTVPGAEADTGPIRVPVKREPGRVSVKRGRHRAVA